MEEGKVEKGGKIEKWKTACLVTIYLLTIILYLYSLSNFKIIPEWLNLIFNITSILIFCAILIPICFCALSQDNILKVRYYIMVQIPYAFLPLAMLIQYSFLNNKCLNNLSISLITLVFILVISFPIYKTLKKINIKHIKYLKYANLILAAIIVIFYSIIGQIKSEVESFFTLAYYSPVLILQAIYEKILLQKECSVCKNNT